MTCVLPEDKGGDRSPTGLLLSCEAVSSPPTVWMTNAGDPKDVSLEDKPVNARFPNSLLLWGNFQL